MYLHARALRDSQLSALCTLQDQLLVVSLIFSNGRQIFSTLSLKPALPSVISKRGIREDQYLEIDPVLAKAFGIVEGDEVGKAGTSDRHVERNHLVHLFFCVCFLRLWSSLLVILRLQERSLSHWTIRVTMKYW